LAKVAMDIVAKRIPADRDGVRIAQMNEYQYRRYLWAHQPLTDFWRIGRGYAKRLEKLGLHTMGDIARCSLGKLSDPLNEEILYREFGKNAELLIDHAWGHETATITDIKNYHSEEHGIYSSQVLMRPYKYHEGLAAAQGMVDSVALSMVKRHVVSADFGIVINYDPQSLQYAPNYQGPVVEDFYGRRTAKPSHAHQKLDLPTASGSELRQIYKQLYEKCVNPNLLIRKITLIVTHMIDEDIAAKTPHFKQVNLFEDPQREIKQERVAAIKRQRDQKLQTTILKLQQKLGNKNVVLHLADLKKGSTTKERNAQIGGHQA
jgi:DNA polymerase V